MPIKTNYANIEKVPIIRMEYRLPSAGLPYLEKFPDFPESIGIRSYSIETEGYLMGNSTMADKMRFITAKVADLPDRFDINELLLADEFTILAIARAQTYGETYQFRAQCPNCAHQELIDVKVPENLPVKVWKRSEPPKLEVRMPHSKDLVEVRLLTIRDDMEASRYVAEMKALSQGVSEDALGYMRRVAHQIKSVNGGTPDNIAEADQYVQRLQGPDMSELSAFIDEMACGIKYDWTICCDKCAFVYERFIPIAGDFFRRNRAYGSPHPKGQHAAAAPESPASSVAAQPAGKHAAGPPAA